MGKLFIDRARGESLVIFQDGKQIIKITRVDRAGRKAYLMIECDESIKIIREELLKEKQDASSRNAAEPNFNR